MKMTESLFLDISNELQILQIDETKLIKSVICKSKNPFIRFFV